MRPGAKIAAWAVGLLIGLPVLATALVLIAANTGPGRRMIEQLAPKLSDDKLSLAGLSGRFPDAIRIAHAEIRDGAGVWLTVDGLTLDWSPLALLRGEAQVETLAAADVAVLRLPSSAKEPSSTSGGPTLPLRVAVADFHVDRLDLAAPVAGAAATLRLNGVFDLAALEQGSASVTAERLDAPGSYKLSGTIGPDTLAAQIAATEPAQGLLVRLADLPDLGALSIAASLAGPRTAEQARLTVAAGPLRAAGQGRIDLVGQTLDIDLTANAPAMTPRPDLRWRSAKLDAHVHGAFTSPAATGRLEIDDLAAAGAAIGQITADISGSGGKATLTAALAGLRLPGPQPDLFGATPITLHADATLNTPTRPVTFTLSHPLLTLTGQADTGDALNASVTLAIPQLAPFAQIAATDLQGRANLTATLSRREETTRIAVDGTVALTGGLPAATGLLGDAATLSLAGTEQGADFTLDHATIDGKALHASAKGSQKGDVVDLDWAVALPDLSRLAPAVSGALTAQGRLNGPSQALALDGTASGDLAAAGLPKGPLSLALHAEGLPGSPSGRIEAQGRLAGAPLQLLAQARRDGDGTIRISLERAQWKSADARGDLVLPPGALVPLGRLRLRMAQLGDLAPLLGTPLTGSVDGALDTVQSRGKPQAQIHLVAQHLEMAGDKLGKLTLEARVDDPAAHPVVALQLDADGIDKDGVTGSARLEAKGGQEALALRLTSDLQTPRGAARVSATATARLPRRELQLTALQADYGGETLRLLGPARFAFANGIVIDGLRLGVGEAVLAVTGRAAPKLALTASLRNASPALVKPFVPGFAAAGAITMEAKLGGTPAAPTGTVQVTGRRLRMQSGPGRAIPAADFDATAELHGASAALQARLAAGPTIQLRLAGTAPLQTTAPFDLHASGTVDLVVLDPLLTPNGRSMRGNATLDLGIAGTVVAPRVNGTLRLADGSFQDFVQGVHITDMNGVIAADGDTLRLTQLTGRAGSGTLAVNGTVGVSAPGLPVNLTITARNARPLASDLLTVTLNGDVTLRGQATGALNLAGSVHVSSANINIPERFPQSVVVLDVRRPGQKPPPPAAPGPAIGLDLRIDAPEQVFVRGHGLDAEMGGRLQVAGTSAAPQIGGGFDLRRGTYSIAGQTLNFTSGRVAFDGGGVTGKLDPTLNFVAQSTANNVTATLQVTGYADAPKIQLSSSPDLPQDEILSHLLFGQSVKQLSPFQLVEIAQAVAALGGVGGSINPLASVRQGLGLDRLSVSGASGGGIGATVEAGKYVANGVYVGTKQGTSGGTQAQVQIDLTKHLKLETQLGTGGGTPTTGATLDNDPGSSIGLTYQFEY